MKQPTLEFRNTEGIDACVRTIYNHILFGTKGHHSAYQEIISPYSFSDPYPLNKVGNFARVSRRYLENWINVGELINLLSTSPINHIFNNKKFSQDEQYWMVTEALYQIGTHSYLAEEWQDRISYDQIDSLIEPNTGVTLLANQTLASSLEDHIIHLFNSFTYNKRKPFTIFDLGTGTGNTIISLIESVEKLSLQNVLPKDYAKNIAIVLIDGQEEALAETFRRLKKRSIHQDDFKSPIRIVKTIKDNFGNLHENHRLTDFYNQVDLIVSGGAIMHNTYKRPFFSTMHSLLNKKGLFGCWDWYFKTFLAPNLKIGQSIRREIHLHEKNSGQWHVYDLGEDEPFNDEIKELQKKSTMKVIGVLPERELILNLKNLMNWVGLFGYLRSDSTGQITDEKKLDSEPISKRLEQVYWDKIHSLQGFNFITDFLCYLNHLEPYQFGAYNYIEGYGDNYSTLLRQEGFRRVKEGSLSQVLINPQQGDPINNDAIRLTYGHK